MPKDKITIQNNDEILELKGDELKAFEEDRKQMQEQASLIEAEATAKKLARESAINKLATIAGLTEEEINSII